MMHSTLLKGLTAALLLVLALPVLAEGNIPPVAIDGVALTSEDTPVVVNLSALDPNDDDLIFAVVSQPTSGSLSGSGAEQTYTPSTNFNGFDSFSFSVSDGTETSNTAAIIVTVFPANDPPVATNDAYSTEKNVALIVSAPGVLGNDGDVDGDLMSAILVAGATSGTVALSTDGSFTYTPNTDFVGADTFTYTLNDGSLNCEIPATVTITVTEPTPPPPPEEEEEEEEEPGGGGDHGGGGGETPPSDGGSGGTGGGGGGGGGGTQSFGGGIVGGAVVLAATTTGEVLGASTEDCPEYLREYIRLGKKNNPAEVTKLQEFLNLFESANLEVNGTYDTPSYNAVHAFQSKYLNDVMGPWGAKSSTGYVYYTTKKKINEIYCKFTKQFPLNTDQEQEIARIRALGTATVPAPAPAPELVVPVVTPKQEEVGAGAQAQTASALDAPAVRSVWQRVRGIFMGLW